MREMNRSEMILKQVFNDTYRDCHLEVLVVDASPSQCEWPHGLGFGLDKLRDREDCVPAGF